MITKISMKMSICAPQDGCERRGLHDRQSITTPQSSDAFSSYDPSDGLKGCERMLRVDHFMLSHHVERDGDGL